MELKTNKEELKDLIRRDRLREFFEKVQAILNINSPFVNKFIHLESRFKRIDSAYDLNIIQYDEYSTGVNKITHSALRFINDISIQDLCTEISTYEKIKGKDYFINFLNSEIWYKWFLESLPSIEECKVVFTESNAHIYFGIVTELKKMLKTENLGLENKRFLDFRIESFSTQDIKEDKGNYPGGMKQIIDKIHSGITFNRIIFLNEPNDEHGHSLKYFVEVNNRWVFFPKPWRVFGNLSIEM